MVDITHFPRRSVCDLVGPNVIENFLLLSEGSGETRTRAFFSASSSAAREHLFNRYTRMLNNQRHAPGDRLQVCHSSSLDRAITIAMSRMLVHEMERERILRNVPLQVSTVLLSHVGDAFAREKKIVQTSANSVILNISSRQATSFTFNSLVARRRRRAELEPSQSLVGQSRDMDAEGKLDRRK